MSEPGGAAANGRLAARRKDLVAAAFTVFSTRGYHAAGVADITAAAGVSHGTFYNYFDNKRHILDAVIDHGVDRVIDEVVGPNRLDAADNLAEAVEQFRAVLGRLFDLLEREPKLVQFVVLEASAIDTVLVQRLLGLFGRFSSITQEYVRHGLQRGYLRDDLDPRMAGEAIMSLLFSVVLVALRGPVIQADRERHIDALADLAFGGVLQR